MKSDINIIYDDLRHSIRTVEFYHKSLDYFYIVYDYYNDNFLDISLTAPDDKVYHKRNWDEITLKEQEAIEYVLFDTKANKP